MASASCLRQVAASHVGFKTVVPSPSPTKPCRVHFPCGFRGHELNVQANMQALSRRKPRLVIAAEAVAETAEVEAEVLPAEETSVVEVEQPGTPARTGKVKKTKGLKNIMQVLHQRAVEAASEGKNIPDIRTGDIVQLRVEVPENKKRVSLLRGIVIAKHNAGIHTTFRTRRVIAGVGVEMVFPLYSPNIKEIKVLSSRKVRRAKLYYLRDKIARLSSC